LLAYLQNSFIVSEPGREALKNDASVKRMWICADNLSLGRSSML